VASRVMPVLHSLRRERTGVQAGGANYTPLIVGSIRTAHHGYVAEANIAEDIPAAATIAPRPSARDCRPMAPVCCRPLAESPFSVRFQRQRQRGGRV